MDIPWYNKPEEVEKNNIFIEDNFDEEIVKAKEQEGKDWNGNKFARKVSWGRRFFYTIS